MTRTHDAAQTSGEAVYFSEVSKSFMSDGTEFTAIQDVNLEVATGRFVCLLGPSGCGKSTLLNMAAGLMQPTAGRVTYEGKALTGVNHEVGYITQKDNLLPWLNVVENVGIALQIRRVPRRERRDRIDQMLKLVGLTGFERRYPGQLSGGMRKRVTLARTLIYNPSTLLMDEPFGALDAQLRAAMQTELLNLWERERKTVLFVTHDVEEAIVLADEIVVFGTKPGRIIAQLPVELARPRQIAELRTTPEFADMVNRLWGLLNHDAGRASGPVDGDPR